MPTRTTTPRPLAPVPLFGVLSHDNATRTVLDSTVQLVNPPELAGVDTEKTLGGVGRAAVLHPGVGVCL